EGAAPAAFSFPAPERCAILPDGVRPRRIRTARDSVGGACCSHRAGPDAKMNRAEAEHRKGRGGTVAVVAMEQMVEACVLLGHQTRRWNPKMKPYIFTERNGIYIVDLQKTVRMLEQAYDFVRNLAFQGGKVLFVGTKKQAQDTIAEEARRCEMFYVNQRWLGGMLTNFSTIRGRIVRLLELEQMAESGYFEDR